MLLLSVVSINIMQNAGIIEKIKLAKEEHRASAIQEQIDLLKNEQEIAKQNNETEPSINELIDNLQEQKLIKSEEKNTILQTGRITIGSKKIIFSKDAILPQGYTRCEYLESTGTQYIDTGIIGKTGVSMEAKFKVLDLTKTRTIGITDGTNRLSLVLPYAGTGYLVNQIGNINKIVTTRRLSVGNTATTKQDGGKLYLNGELIDTVTPNTFNTNMTLYMFAQHANPMVSFDISRVYNIKIWENGELVRNFIPCLDTNNTPCMYDTVTGQTFYNQGTGEFIAGPIVE